MSYADSKGVKLYYEVHGEGRPIVFVHGGGGNTLSWFQQDFIERNPGMNFLYDQIRVLNQPFDARRMQDDDVKLHPKDFECYRVPTLMMGGALDFFFTPDSHRHVATPIPGAELYEFPQSAHSAYFEEPEHFNRVVGEFLARCYPAVA